MTKTETELIILKVTADGQDAINMKIYKNGTTCRYGAGGLPQVHISGMSFFNDSRFFAPLIAEIPDGAFDKPQMYEEDTPNGYLEYVIAFYGVSKNGETGERAEWTKSTGTRIKIDKESDFRHPILSFMDSLIMYGTELTNEWYFDIMLNARYNARSSALPKETIITQPKTEAEVHNAFEIYINQILTGAKKWNLKDFNKNKTYTINGKVCTGRIEQDGQSFGIYFVPQENNTEIKESTKKPWWKL